jgi:hypothetical protein
MCDALERLAAFYMRTFLTEVCRNVHGEWFKTKNTLMLIACTERDVEFSLHILESLYIV